MKLIVALDFDSEQQTFQLVDKLDPTQCAVKVGSELFTRFGANLVRQLTSRAFKVFLDLKWHDIPQTVSRAVAAGAELGVWMMTIHACGGLSMLKAAAEANQHAAELMAVTVLTSLSDSDLPAIGVNLPLTSYAIHLADLAQQAGCDGVISSAWEVSAIKQQFGNEFLTVTPGIRLQNAAEDDQRRVMTVSDAIQAGSDYLVIGRPITRSPDPMQVVNKILVTIQNVSPNASS